MLYNLARIGAMTTLLAFIYAVLPNADTDTSALTIPAELWNPITAVLALDHYFPIAKLLALAVLGLGIKVALPAFWGLSWALKKLLP